MAGAIDGAFAFGTPSPFASEASRILDFVDTPGVAGRLEISGDYAFIADYNGGLRVADISNPADLSIVSSLDDQGTFDPVEDLLIQGTLLYLARNGSGLQIVDISDPTAPQILSTTDIPTGVSEVAQDVAVSGNHAFVSYVNYGIVVLDISDPAAPTEVPAAGYPGSTSDIIVNGQYVYALKKAIGNTQFLVFDTQDVNNPSLNGVGSEIIDGDGWKLTLAGTTLLVSRNKSGAGAYITSYPPYDDGLHILDVSDAMNGRLLLDVGGFSGAAGAWVYGSRLYIRDWSLGLMVFDM